MAVFKPSKLAPASSGLLASVIPTYLDNRAVKVINLFCSSIASAIPTYLDKRAIKVIQGGPNVW